MTDNGTILVVDDTAATLKLMANLLRVAGYVVQTADNGEAALASVAAGSPDLVLLDLRLPGMDGFEVIRRLKAQQHTRSIPVMFISGASDVEDRVQGLKLGAVDYISKPLQPVELLARVHTHVELSPAAAALDRQAAELRETNERLKREVELRQHAQQALRGSHGLLEAIVEGTTDAIYVKDKAGRYLLANATVSRLVQKPLDQILGRDDTTLFPPEEAAVVMEADRLTMALKGPRTFEETVTVDTGVRTYLSTKGPLHDSDGGVTGLFGIARDITKLKLAREAMRESENSLREAQVIAGLGNYSWDFASGLWKSSAVLDQIFGIDQAYQRTFDGWAVLIHPDDRAMMVSYVTNEVVGQGREFDREYRIIRPSDQTQRWVHGRGRVDRDAQGHPINLHGIIQDITARKKAESALRAAKEAAETATQVKERFLANLSHELRTPLTPVLMVVSQWQTQPNLPAAVLDDLAMVCRNLEMEARLLDDLLDVNRILYGKLSLRRDVFRVHKVIGEALAIVASAVQSKRVSVNVVLQAADDRVEGDSARVQQILWNLLSNAIKFTSDSGNITISTANEPGGQIRIQVTDSGMGIEPPVLARLFTPFEQGEQRINRQYGGMGLGLSICNSLAEAHGGSITAASEGIGKGSTFTVRLPLARDLAQVKPVVALPPAQAAPASGPLRILLVEDNADTTRIMSRLLRSKGYVVETADDVASALERLKRSDFDILVSDLGLPDGSGHDVMRQLIASGKAVKGIAVSGYGTEDDLHKSREAGFAEHLVKPISFARLQAAIERVAAERTASAEQDRGSK